MSVSIIYWAVIYLEELQLLPWKTHTNTHTHAGPLWRRTQSTYINVSSFLHKISSHLKVAVSWQRTCTHTHTYWWDLHVREADVMADVVKMIPNCIGDVATHKRWYKLWGTGQLVQCVFMYVCVIARNFPNLLTMQMKHSPWARCHDSRPYVIVTTVSGQTVMLLRYARAHRDKLLRLQFI